MFIRYNLIGGAVSKNEGSENAGLWVQGDYAGLRVCSFILLRLLVATLLIFECIFVDVSVHQSKPDHEVVMDVNAR